jgi:hypothetical protein
MPSPTLRNRSLFLNDPPELDVATPNTNRRESFNIGFPMCVEQRLECECSLQCREARVGLHLDLLAVRVAGGPKAMLPTA